jgi:hypothetical protein
MGTLPARFAPNRIIGILQTIYKISSSASVHLEKLPQFGRSKDIQQATLRIATANPPTRASQRLARRARFSFDHGVGRCSVQEAFGVEVIESRHAKADIRWLAAHPEARAMELMQPASAPDFSRRNAARSGRWSSQTCCVLTLK